MNAREQDENLKLGALVQETFRSKDIDKIAHAIDATCEVKGWNTDNRDESEWAALAHTEISEAYESYRNGEPLYFVGDGGKPEGAAIEYADCIIRCLHWFIRHDLNPSTFIGMKMMYNTQRPFRHGGKKA